MWAILIKKCHKNCTTTTTKRTKCWTFLLSGDRGESDSICLSRGWGAGSAKGKLPNRDDT